MKKTLIYTLVSFAVAEFVTNYTDAVFFFGVVWANLFVSLGVLAYKADK